MHLCTTLGFRGILLYTYIKCNCKFEHMYIHKCLYMLNKLIIIIIILADGSNRVTVVLRNNTRDWLEIKKGIPIAWMVAANEVPEVTNLLFAEEPKEQPTLIEAERQDLLLGKLDLTGLEAWPKDQAEKAHSLLKEYHDIFSLEKCDVGHTKAAKHKIILKDLDTPPFKERFC